MMQDADTNPDIQTQTKPGWYKVNGFLSWFQNDESKLMYYLSCPTCKKKVIDEAGGYRCEKCQKTFNEAIPIYNFAFRLNDFTNGLILQCLGEVGEQIMGVPAVVVHENAALAR